MPREKKQLWASANSFLFFNQCTLKFSEYLRLSMSKCSENNKPQGLMPREKKATVSKCEQFFVTYYSPARLGIFFAHAKGYDIAIWNITFWEYNPE